MKKATTDAKKAAANDRENGNGKAVPKAVKQTYAAARQPPLNEYGKKGECSQLHTREGM